MALTETSGVKTESQRESLMAKTVEELEAELTAVKGRKPTRAEVRSALRCPICKKDGALLGDKCRECGSYQDSESGNWITPKPEDPPAKPVERGKGGKKDPWLEW